MKGAWLRRLEGTDGRAAGECRMMRNSEAFVTADAEALLTVAAGAVGLVAACIHGMATDVVAAMNVVRFDNGVVTA